MGRKKMIPAAVVVLTLLGSGLWIAWGNKALTVTHYTIRSDNLPSGFTGFRIAQISDLHNTEIGTGNEKLIKALKSTSPDLIVITGDMADSRRTDLQIALDFARKAAAIAPVYYVTGNHEARLSEYTQLEEGLIQAGVTVLNNKSISVAQNGEEIILIGLEDPGFYPAWSPGEVVKTQLENLIHQASDFTVLLSHRPELIDVYSHYPVDLVLSGHTHGGQVRLPLLGGIVAPGQGFFPEYDAGLFWVNDSQMIVSRGIGNSAFPLRVNNPPEITIIELCNS